MDKIKVCHVSMYYDPIVGGQESYIKTFISSTSNIIENSVIQSTQEGVNNLKNVKYTRYFWYTYKLKKIIFNFDWYIFNIQLLLNKKWLSQFDVLICHYFFHYPFVMWHPKVIVLSHGVLWDNSKLTLFDRFHKITLKFFKKKKHVLVANDTEFLREIGLKINAGTSFFEEIQKKNWFFPNTINPSVFKNDKSIVKEKIILLPRNIRYDRGIHIAIESFSIFEKNNKDFVLIVAGSFGAKFYFDYCKELVEKLNLQTKVNFIGSVTQNELIELYNKSTMTIIPSIAKEGTSLSALESMMCGTPVVSTNIGGLKDIPCLHCNPDVNSLTIGMTELLENIEQETINQFENVHNYFTTEKWTNMWVYLINKLKHE
ncbi:MAG: glycosyltransferase [Bacteroidota bacterium]